MQTIGIRQTARRPGLRFRPLYWLMRLDAAHREMRRFRTLDDDRLEDMGLTKAERDQAFYRQFAERGLR